MADTFRPLDRVRVRAGHPHAAGWEGLIVAPTSAPAWTVQAQDAEQERDLPVDGWYEFVPLREEAAPEVWPSEDVIRFHASELELVEPWKPYPASAPYPPPHQAWMSWMGERAVSTPHISTAHGSMTCRICGEPMGDEPADWHFPQYGPAHERCVNEDGIQRMSGETR